MENNLIARKKTILALSQAKGIGYFTIRKLYSVFPNLEILESYRLDDLIALFNKANIKYAERLVHSFFDNKHELFDKVDIIYSELFKKRKISFIVDSEPIFPKSLQKIPDKPFWLFVEGNLDILNNAKNVAVVGTRYPTYKGIKIAEQLTALLVKNNYLIVSGLAEGIDEATHRVTNQLKGKGIAILGCGINFGFPSKTFKLREELVANGGAIITEYMINDFYSRQKFVWRDRLQSGLSKGIFPIQGTLKSGTTHTIKFAEQQKKKIIGIFLNKIEHIPQNELFIYLKKIGCPIYDIDVDKEKILKEIESVGETKSMLPMEERDLFSIKKKLEIEEIKEKRNLFRFILDLLRWN